MDFTDANDNATTNLADAFKSKMSNLEFKLARRTKTFKETKKELTKEELANKRK